MTPRNRRAVLILVVWFIGVIAWLVTRGLLIRRNEIRAVRASLSALAIRNSRLQKELDSARKERDGFQKNALPVWYGLPEDQLRLRFQDAILAASQKAGLQDVRLRAPGTTGTPDRWRIEAVGTLVQWADFIEGVAKGGMPLDLIAIHWLVNGDPWTPPHGDTPAGPPLRGEAEWSATAIPEIPKPS